MRIIKFRGKHIYTGEWVYGSLVVFNLKNMAITSPVGITVAVAPETVGQFIGVLDINKKEIYEGDIVKWPMEKFEYDGSVSIKTTCLGLVKYSDSGASFYLHRDVQYKG